MLNDFGHELGAFAYVISAGDEGDPELLAEAWKEINDKGTHAGIDAIQTELNLFTFGINAEGSPLYSTALNAFGSKFANLMQASAQSPEGLVNGGLQAAGLWANYRGFLLDGGMQTLYDLDAKIENEVDQGVVSLKNAFGELVGNLDIPFTGPDYPPLTALDLTSDSNEDDFYTLAGTDGNYVMIVPLNDPNFDYPNADLSAVDPLTGNTELGSVTLDVSDLNAQNPLTPPTMSGACSDDDADDPDSDDPDCDNVGRLFSPMGVVRNYLAMLRENRALRFTDATRPAGRPGPRWR